MLKLLCGALACALPAVAFAQSDAVTEGSMRAVGVDGRPASLPLKHTDVEAEISGFVARVKVEQVFENPFPMPVEAIYVFPLPDRGGVDSMTLTVGDRVVKGEIKRRQEARAIYEQAKSRGQTAALLDQERANVFTQSVANLAPGVPIRVTLTYVAPLEYDHGEYTFNFPMVVGPRYIPGGALPGQSQGTGVVHDTDQVVDASRITPALLGPGMRSGHDISVKVTLDAGVAIQDLRSPSHDVAIFRKGQREATVELKAGDAIPNKDFILRYKVAGRAMEAGVLTHRDERGGFFTLMIQPQADFRQRELTAKEMFFVIDQSCSQSGLPIEKEKGIVNEALDKMNPADTFQIMTFNNGVHVLADRPMANTAENVRRARHFVNGLTANGGTEMLGGVVACLDAPRDPERLRFVMFLTDGYVGNDDQIIHAVEKHVGNTRLYTYGVGSSVNHYLLDRMAELGRGYTQYARPDEDTLKSVSLFYERIAKPYLVDVSVDFADLGVKDAYPRVIRDLFAYQPIILTGRFEGAGGSGTVTLHGKVGGVRHDTKIQVDFPKAAQAENEALASMYGRARIEYLTGQQYGGERAEIVQSITRTALEYHLMSPYTSFVAVEEHRVEGANGRPPTVAQPVEVPEGTTGEAFGAGNVTSTAQPPAPPAEMMHRPPSHAAAPKSEDLDVSASSDDSGGGGGGGFLGFFGKRSAPTPSPAVVSSPAPSQPAPAKPAEKALAEPRQRFAPQPATDAPAGYPVGGELGQDLGGADKAPRAHATSSLSVEQLIVKGSLPRGAAEVVLRSVWQRLVKRAGAWAGASGTVLVKVTVSAAGTVSDVTVLQDGVQSAAFTLELKQALAAAKFPAGAEESTLTFTLRVR